MPRKKKEPPLKCFQCGREHGAPDDRPVLNQTVEIIDYLGLKMCRSCVWAIVSSKPKPPLKKHYSKDEERWAAWLKANPPAKLGIDVKIETK